MRREGGTWTRTKGEGEWVSGSGSVRLGSRAGRSGRWHGTGQRQRGKCKCKAKGTCKKQSKRQVQKAKCTGMGTAVTKPDGGIVMAVKSRLSVGSGKYRSGPRQRYGIGSRSLSVQGAREWHVHRLAESWWGGTGRQTGRQQGGQQTTDGRTEKDVRKTSWIRQWMARNRQHTYQGDRQQAGKDEQAHPSIIIPFPSQEWPSLGGHTASGRRMNHCTACGEAVAYPLEHDDQTGVAHPLYGSNSAWTVCCCGLSVTRPCVSGRIKASGPQHPHHIIRWTLQTVDSHRYCLGIACWLVAWDWTDRGCCAGTNDTIS